MCFHELKLSVYDVIVNQKGSNGDGKLQFFGQEYKNELMEINSIVPKGHKIKAKLSNGDYFFPY